MLTEIPQADAVHQMLKDELDLDGRPNLNLASFVGTYMERDAEALMIENLSKNMSDSDEYPALMAIHARCISIIAHLWGVQKGETAIGSATTGSSEAIHLGGLAMKRRWQERRRAEGKDTTNPNIVMGANAQVALEKFARYFEVDARILPVSEKSNFVLDPELVKESIDENTIGIFVILGSTYTGHYEPVEKIHQILDEYEARLVLTSRSTSTPPLEDSLHHSRMRKLEDRSGISNYPVSNPSTPQDTNLAWYMQASASSSGETSLTSPSI